MGFLYTGSTDYAAPIAALELPKLAVYAATAVVLVKAVRVADTWLRKSYEMAQEKLQVRTHTHHTYLAINTMAAVMGGVGCLVMIDAVARGALLLATGAAAGGAILLTTLFVIALTQYVSKSSLHLDSKWKW